MCLWLEVGHQDLKKKKKLFPPDEEYLKSLTQRCTESLSTSAVLNCKLFRSTLQNKRTIQTCEGGPDCVLIHPTAMNPSLHTITQRTQYVGAAFSFVLFFFWQSCIEELIPPLSGVPCESVTFSVPSISSCRFLCHLCTTHLPCILSWRRVPLYIMRKVLWTTQQSSRDLHRKWTPEESHSA